MKEQVNQLFKDVYDKYFADGVGETCHDIKNGVQIYTNSYRENETYMTLCFDGIEINKNGEIKFDNYELFEKNFNIDTFILFLRERLVDGVLNECDADYFFSYRKSIPVQTKTNNCETEYKIKADILDKIINRKLIIE